MKTIALAIPFIAIILGFQNAFAQTEPQISKIRARVAAINKNIGKYKKTVRDVDEISLEGTQATFYSAGSDLQKTTAKIYGESYNAVAEIYYEKNIPIFIYEKLNKYDRTIGETNAPKIVSVEETRIYYVEGRIVKMLAGKRAIKPADEKFEETSREFSEIAKKLFEAFKN
jgi:hypothetical protein